MIAAFAAGVRRSRRIVALIGLLVRTRSEHPGLSDSAAGQALRAYFTRRWLGFFPLNRLCRGVLILPRQHSDYLRGPRRQAVRRNLRRAAAVGISCETIVDRVRANDLLEEVLEGALNAEGAKHCRAAVARPEVTVFAARDRSGHPVAVAGAVIDETACLLEFAITRSTAPSANNLEARWALHDHLVRLLIDRRVRYLVADGGGAFGALSYSPAIQHYQHLLGYELRHVKPHSAGWTPSRDVRKSQATLRLHWDEAKSLAVTEPLPIEDPRLRIASERGPGRRAA